MDNASKCIHYRFQTIRPPVSSPHPDDPSLVYEQQLALSSPSLSSSSSSTSSIAASSLITHYHDLPFTTTARELTPQSIPIRRILGANGYWQESDNHDVDPSNTPTLPINPSGCARTEGFMKRNTGVRSFSEPSYGSNPHYGNYGVGYGNGYGYGYNANGNTDALFNMDSKFHTARRSSKYQTTLHEKRMTKDLPLSIQYRLMKQRPQPRVAHSPIHQWGLFAMERIEPHTMVIEYLGELIRQKVADIREKRYEAIGLGCYMFRIDDDAIVDSTKRGNVSRFINHSCDPNCYTKVVTIDGQKKIIVFSNRVIERGTEITYDYFFASETSRIACNCGASNCTGRLN